MPVLNRYYDQLFKELVKLFEECPEAVECFHGGEYVYSGRDWNSEEYWRVTLSESIRYADGIILAQQRDKQKKRGIRAFLPQIFKKNIVIFLVGLVHFDC